MAGQSHDRSTTTRRRPGRRASWHRSPREQAAVVKTKEKPAACVARRLGWPPHLPAARPASTAPCFTAGATSRKSGERSRGYRRCRRGSERRSPPPPCHQPRRPPPPPGHLLRIPVAQADPELPPPARRRGGAATVTRGGRRWCGGSGGHGQPCLGPAVGCGTHARHAAGSGTHTPLRHLRKARPFLGRVARWSRGSLLVEVTRVAGWPHAGVEAAPLVGSCSALGSGATRLVGIVNLHGVLSLFTSLGSYLPRVILAPSPYLSLTFLPPFTPPHPGRALVALHGWPVDDPLVAGASHPTTVGRSLICRWLSSRWRSLTYRCSPSSLSWTARCHPIDLPLIQALTVGYVELVLGALAKALPGIRQC
uniref:Uncharacterized protein n=1 Tax=Setaria viridis TaxID=4556 RepID=A0A4U6V1M6_SETVI|nr:hypothetical protein SEVIR_4G150800v2 [Setaria viridis]